MKPITIKLYGTKEKGRILPDEKAFRGHVVAAGPARITVEIEIDDDHGLRMGVPVLLVRDSHTEFDEMAMRITDENAKKMRSLIRKEGKAGITNGGGLCRDLLKRRSELLRARKTTRRI